MIHRIVIAVAVTALLLAGLPIGAYAHHRDWHTANCKNFPESEFCQKPSINTEDTVITRNRLAAELSENINIQYSNMTVPDISLSGQPVNGDPSLRYIEYDSLYEVISRDPHGAMLVMLAVDYSGIDWNGLSDEQKAYLILTARIEM